MEEISYVQLGRYRLHLRRHHFACCDENALTGQYATFIFVRGEEFEVLGIVVQRTQQLRKGEKSQGLPAQEDLFIEPIVQTDFGFIDKRREIYHLVNSSQLSL
jgi:hypothetical protein